MKSDDKIEPIGEAAAAALKRSLSEWQDIASQILELLHEQTAAGWSANWHPHVDQIVGVVARFRDGCRDEFEKICAYGADDEQADDVHERMWREGDRLAKWLQRMTS